ncbi:MAG: hypothetical protein IPG97_07210 [Microthrixaceae bacterium]|nr:hypothetical protein [Microthrixaceae bacterium]
MAVDLPDDPLRRLRGEAARRGVALDEFEVDVEGLLGAKTSGQAEGLRRLTGSAPGISEVYSRAEDWPE